MNEREIYWIKKLNAINEGYNIATGGEGGDTISNHPNKIQIAQKHSLAMKGTTRIRSLSEIEKWKKSYIGKYKGENSPNYGKKHSSKTKKLMSEIRIKYWDNLSDIER